jgi:hypothetical protein
MPPGGPVDEDPPKLLRVRPDSNATNVRAGAIGFDFDEVISERPQGVPNLAGLFLISPSEGTPHLSWRRTRLEVRPRGGFRANTTYEIRMLPGLTDLDGNVDSTGTTIVFSTGAAIASGSIAGVVFDWMADRGAAGALVEAITLPDSTRYLAYADSTGRYTIRHLPRGTFVVRALVDQNRNRLPDAREPYDTATVTLADSARRNLLAVGRDTLGPGIERVEVVDSVTLRVRFDRVLDTAQVISPALFTLKDSDSTVIAIASALGARQLQRLRDDSLAAKAASDSALAKLAADSAARADSAAGRARPRPTPVPLPPPRAAAAAATRDTAREPPLKHGVRIPEQEAVLTVGAPLRPGTNFRLRVDRLRSIVGRVRSPERQFATPRRRPAADTTARRDTTSRDG